MCSNSKRDFFFYNRFKSDTYLEKISMNYKETPGYIYVKKYNLKIDYVYIGEGNNTKLFGKIINFKYLNNNDVLNKIIKIISKNINVKKNISNYKFNMNDILTILNKYNWFDRVIDFLPPNFCMDRKYRLIITKAYINNNEIREVNVII